MARVLAIDYGQKRTGLAVTDPLQLIASGLETVETNKLLDYLSKYITSEDVTTIVVGEPTHADGTATHIEKNIQELISKISKNYPNVVIKRQDERYTSVEAKRVILESGVKKMKRRDKSLIDKVSAAIILQQYMEAHVWNNNSSLY